MPKGWNKDIKVGNYVFATKYGTKCFDSPWRVGVVSSIIDFGKYGIKYKLWVNSEKIIDGEYFYEFSYARNVSKKEGENILKEGFEFCRLNSIKI